MRREKKTHKENSVWSIRMYRSKAKAIENDNLPQFSPQNTLLSVFPHFSRSLSVVFRFLFRSAIIRYSHWLVFLFFKLQ